MLTGFQQGRNHTDDLGKTALAAHLHCCIAGMQQMHCCIAPALLHCRKRWLLERMSRWWGPLHSFWTLQSSYGQELSRLCVVRIAPFEQITWNAPLWANNATMWIQVSTNRNSCTAKPGPLAGTFLGIYLLHDSRLGRRRAYYPILSTLSKLAALGTAEDLRLAVDECQHNKALGADGITSGVIKVVEVCDLLCCSWIEKSFPHKFQNHHPFKSKGDRNDCKSPETFRRPAFMERCLLNFFCQGFVFWQKFFFFLNWNASFRSNHSSSNVLFSVRQMQKKLQE